MSVVVHTTGRNLDNIDRDFLDAMQRLDEYSSGFTGNAKEASEDNR
ncbi:MAG: hypothetical protein NTW12_06435 [Deltaproteobacteria bacterium]|nr:hypothetical protein [Deltaproteobacteria bacterium]